MTMNKTVTVRMSQETYNSVKSIARRKKEKIQTVLEEAVRDYKKKQFFEDLDAAYARLIANPESRAEEEAEREEWDIALQDGIEDEDGDR
jgi:predicted transcriptional regulator